MVRNARVKELNDLIEREQSERLGEAAIFAGPAAPVRNVQGQIIERIGLAIVRGDIAPGEPLPSEVRLCEMLGVSRTVVREAVRGLVAKGIVDAKARRGTQVRDPAHWNHLDPDVLRWRVEATDTETYLKKMFQLRRATEPEACALAALEANEEDHGRLSHDFQAMVEAGADNAAWVEADLAFHKTIYLATHNEFFWPIGQLFSFGLKQMFAIAALGSHRPRAIIEHGNLVDAILARKPYHAREAALILLGNATDDIERIRQAADKTLR
jgi:DNA-binding FadR family transcriptional regulator